MNKPNPHLADFTDKDLLLQLVHRDSPSDKRKLVAEIAARAALVDQHWAARFMAMGDK